MRIQHLFLSLILLSASNGSIAQVENQKNVQLTEAQVLWGGNFSSMHSVNLDEMKKLAPNSSILAKDYSDFNQSSYPYINQNNQFSVNLGLSFKKLPSATLRLGLSYASKQLFYGSLANFTTHPYDTLTSSQTGQQYYIDSSHMRITQFDHSSDNLGLDVSLIFRTKPEARWSIYGGIGYSLAVGFNATSRINYYEYSATTGAYSGGIILGNPIYESESINSKTFISNTIYLPMGVDFRIGKKREFWNRIHLFYELKPSITFNHIPELGTKTYLGFGHGLGIRVKW